MTNEKFLESGGPRGPPRVLREGPPSPPTAPSSAASRARTGAASSGAPALATMAAMVGAAIPVPPQHAGGAHPRRVRGRERAGWARTGSPSSTTRPVNAGDPAASPRRRDHPDGAPLHPQQRDSRRRRWDADAWTLTVDGLVDRPTTYSIADLRSKFEVVTMALAIECGGNGRGLLRPAREGQPVDLRSGRVLALDGGAPQGRAHRGRGSGRGVVYTAHVGADAHLSGKPDKLPISRGVPIAKAMTDNVLIAFGQNDGPIHPMNGRAAPARGAGGGRARARRSG